MPDSVVGLARFFQIEETYTKDKNTLNLLIPWICQIPNKNSYSNGKS